MKFIKKLVTFLLIVAIFAGIGFLFWHLYGDQIVMEVKNLQKSMEKNEQRAVLAEQNKEFLDVLKTAQDHIGKADLLECEIYVEHTGEDDRQWMSTTAWNREQSLFRRSAAENENMVRDYIGKERILINQNNRIVTEHWVIYETDDPQSMQYPARELYHTDERGDQIVSAQWNQWYYYWGGAISYDFFFRNGVVPINAITGMNVLSYQDLGSEDCDGVQATHYLVTHEPILHLPVPLEEQFNIWDETNKQTVFYAPREFFETVIPQDVKDTYPDAYSSLMEIIDRRYYQDNQTHLWISEEGKLLKMEFDYTADLYTDEIRWSGFLRNVYDEATGEYVTAPIDLSPVTRVVCFSYNDDVEPIVLPTEYIDLTKE